MSRHKSVVRMHDGPAPVVRALMRGLVLFVLVAVVGLAARPTVLVAQEEPKAQLEEPPEDQTEEPVPQNEEEQAEAEPEEVPQEEQPTGDDETLEEEPDLSLLEAPLIKEADGAVMLDSAGNVLFAHNPQKELPPASTTKVMTAMVALDSGLPLDEPHKLVAPDLGEGSQMAGYEEGDQATLRELIQVMLVYSGNDAAYNVGCIVGGNEHDFAELMNQKAAELGLEHTHFVNAHGLETDGHYSCALDLATMGRHALQNYPLIAQSVMLHTTVAHAHGDEVVLGSTDRLLGSYPGARGIKTGAIADSYAFLGASGRGSVQLYTGVLGCPTWSGRFDDTEALMDWAYAHYVDRMLAEFQYPVRLHTYAFDMSLKSLVGMDVRYDGKVWDQGTGLSYQSVLPRANRLLGVGEDCGCINWSQDGRAVGKSFYAERRIPSHVSSWPVFSLPLFYDVQTLGKEMLDA